MNFTKFGFGFSYSTMTPSRQPSCRLSIDTSRRRTRSGGASLTLSIKWDGTPVGKETMLAKNKANVTGADQEVAILVRKFRLPSLSH